MMRKYLSVLLGIAITMVVNLTEASVISNGSFESNDFNGWNSTELNSVVTEFGDKHAVDGNYFAILSSGLGKYVYSTMEQEFSVSAGQTLNLSAFFQTGDYMPFYNDNAFISLYNSDDTLAEKLFSSDVDSVGNFGSTPWTPVSYTFKNSGTFKLKFGVENVIDNSNNSFLGVDNIYISPVPEPEEWAMMLLGLPLMGFVARRRKA